MIADRLLVGFVFRGCGRCVFFEVEHLTGGLVLKKTNKLDATCFRDFGWGAAARSDEIKSSGHTRLRPGFSLNCSCNIQDHGRTMSTSMILVLADRGFFFRGFQTSMDRSRRDHSSTADLLSTTPSSSNPTKPLTRNNRHTSLQKTFEHPSLDHE